MPGPTTGHPGLVDHGIMMFPTDGAIDPASLAKEVDADTVRRELDALVPLTR